MTERFCGVLRPCIKSRRFPFANLDSHVVATAQLMQIKSRYDVSEQLALQPKKEEGAGVFRVPQCEFYYVYTY